jgi:hypothetical protein
LIAKDNSPIQWPRLGPLLCRVCCMIFPSVFSDRQLLPVATCNMNATYGPVIFATG